MIKKTIISLFLSFVILNIICFFIYNIPGRAIDDTGATDYKWPTNSFHSKIDEGFSFGFVNNDGYNNSIDYQEGDQIDILFMGSSHIEGFNIPNDYNVTELLNNDTKFNVYNIGVSEHSLPICIANMENAIEKYHPSKYIIIDTQQISFAKEEIDNAFNTSLPTYSDGIINFLQNFKFLKLIRYQLNKTNQTNWLSYTNDEAATDLMLKQASDICKKNGLELIIVFHPHFSIDNDGNTSFLYNISHYDSFVNSSNIYDIKFINMEECFISNYKNLNLVPYGFYNTLIGEGHLNINGHRMLADEIEKAIEE